MSPSGKGCGPYVEKVRDTTQQYVKDLLEDNDTLRKMVQLREADLAQLEEFEFGLQSQVQTLNAELAELKAKREALEQELTLIETDHQHFAAKYSVIEQENNNLANLYVASYQLHSTLDHTQVVEGIKEIVINLIGSEDFAILEVVAGRQELELIGSFGLADDVWRRVPIGNGLIGACVASGTSYIKGRDDDSRQLASEAGLVACVPLNLDGSVIALIVIFSLLPQKSGELVELDHELFDLLATHAGPALYCTKLHQKVNSGEIIAAR